MTSITYPKLKYRLVRNRRILFVSGALAGFGGMLSILIGPSTTFFNDPMVFTTFLGLWLLAMATLVVRYPNNWMDPVGLSLALVPFIAATPVYEMLLTLPTGDRLVLGALWMIFLVSFGWFFTYLGFISLARQWIFHKYPGTALRRCAQDDRRFTHWPTCGRDNGSGCVLLEYQDGSIQGLVGQGTRCMEKRCSIDLACDRRDS